MVSKNATITAAILIVTFAIVIAVQGSGSPEEDPGTAGETVRAEAFSLIDIETGETITLEGYADEPLVIHVFASWCGLCAGTARSIAAYHDAEDFNVLLISADTRENDAALIGFKERIGRDSWKVVRLTPEFERTYGVRSLDTKFVIDAQGAISHTDSRMWNANDAQRFIGAVV